MIELIVPPSRRNSHVWETTRDPVWPEIRTFTTGSYARS
jgi:hypothetical protein